MNPLDPESLVGETLEGRYKILKTLGEGGFGCVYKARDEKLGVPVAVKTPLIQYLREKHFVERFQREARYLLKFEHPHIIKLRDFGQHEYLPFIVLQFASGGALGDKIQEYQSLPVVARIKKVQHWLPKIALALDTLHAEGIIHRDVKPDNILFDRHGEPYLSDFGLSKLTEGPQVGDMSLTTVGGWVGTPWYMPLETLSRGTWTSDSDQYSLGVTVFHMLIGSLPFEDSSIVQLVESMKRGLPDIQSMLGSGHTQLVKSLQTILQSEPSKRFESCSQFASRIAERDIGDESKSERSHAPVVITNSIGMQLVAIPSGKFTMGSDDEYGEDEQPPHEVTLTQSFHLGMTPVTQVQYEQVMGINPSFFEGNEVMGRESSEFPVEQVSWDDAVEFCRKLSALPEEKAAGRVYRLPTEAEWEYACRAGTTTEYSFGDDEWEELGEYAWYNENSDGTTHPVGQKQPNPWGLYDMHGNVEEWCRDWFGDYRSGAVTDPMGPKSGSYRVFRGGSWYYTAEVCRSANRDWRDPSNRTDLSGFRVACVPSRQ